MCVIAVIPKDKTLNRQEMLNMWKTNSDGGGFAYINNRGEITVRKAMQFPDFWEQYQGHRSNAMHRDFLVHMRIATAGSICLENSHPVVITPNLVGAHNGIIGWCEPDRKKQGPIDDRSDTLVFFEEYLSKLPPNWLDMPGVVHLVSNIVGWSKFAFLSTEPSLTKNVYIVNENDGTWLNGIWYSNTSHNWMVGSGYGRFSAAEEDEWEGYEWKQTGAASHKLVKVGAGEWVQTTWCALCKDYRALCDESNAVNYHPEGMQWSATAGDWVPVLSTAFQKAIPPSFGNTKPVATATSIQEILERKKLMEVVGLIRETELFINKAIQLDGLDIECIGCWYAVDETTGDCECWDTWCAKCSEILAQCACSEGDPNHLEEMEVDKAYAAIEAPKRL